MAASSKKETKYPRTPHLPFSPAFIQQVKAEAGDDEADIGIPADGCSSLISEEVVITEKLDGGNCAIFQGKVFARSHGEEATHASFGPIKQLASQIKYLVDDETWLFGENMFGIHSIEYNRLSSYFYLFAVRKGSRWLAWDEVERTADELGIPAVPVLFRGRFASLTGVQEWMTSHIGNENSQVGSVHPEGFVLRVAREFETREFERSMAKFVRESHIQTDETWKRTWKAAKLGA